MTSISSRLASYFPFPEKSSGKILSFENKERAVMKRAQTNRAMYIPMLSIGASVGLANKSNTRLVGQAKFTVY